MNKKNCKRKQIDFEKIMAKDENGEFIWEIKPNPDGCFQNRKTGEVRDLL